MKKSAKAAKKSTGKTVPVKAGPVPADYDARTMGAMRSESKKTPAHLAKRFTPPKY